MTKDLMRYDLLTQNALRGVIREALSKTQELGAAPGEHHFYITFNTHAPGVDISDDLKSSYPDEMTIVLQNRFWDLNVDHEGFSVVLTFQQQPETLKIPFSAVTRFFDPSVQFGLKFDLPETPPPPPEKKEEPDDDDAPHGDAAVVSLDQFRKR
ncbi:MAG: ClpXP protease specificity-enhancing factor SspB [Pseudomonadota bacterium]